jgi:hypothetical protein
MKGQAALGDEREAQPDSIGFDWGKEHSGSQFDKWGQRFQQLVNYKEAHGDCKVPARYSVDPPLASWVNVQRAKKRKATLSDERKAQLESIGFDWGKESGSRRIIS